MIKDLITKSFEARNTAHANHWTTNSFSQHEALGEFYEDIIGVLDRYVEAYQGTFGQLEQAPEQVKDIAKFLRKDLLWLNSNRKEIARGVPALENILDEMTAVYMKTLYKIENLR
jgi:Family of unknown function (DUF5856)